MKLVGIDASLTSTGIAVSNGQGLLVSTENIASKKRGPERLIEIREIVRDMVVFADLVTLEDYAYSRANQAHQTGELGGVLRVMLHEMNKKVLIVSTTQLKKFATGKGNSSKEEVAVGIYKKWGKEFKTNDEADAFVLVQIGLAYMDCIKRDADYLLNNYNNYQLEVIDALYGKSEVKKKVKKKAK